MTRAITALWIVLVCILSPCHAQEVTLNFRNADLLGVLEFYSKLTGKVFVPSEQVAGNVTVISPGPLSEDQAIKLLFSILDMRGYAVVEVDDYYKVVPKPNALNSAAPPSQARVAGDRLVTEVITPRYINVGNLVESVRGFISQEGKLVVDANLNFLAVTDIASNVRQLQQLIERLDKPVAVPVSRTYNLQYAKVEELTQLITTMLQGVQAAQGPGAGVPATVLPDLRTNTLIVNAPEQDHEKVRLIVEELDTRSPQVLLEATIVEVTLNDSSKLGVQWQFLFSESPFSALSLSEQDRADILSNSEVLPPLRGLAFALLSPGDYAALINLLASDTNARILSAPHLMASNNQEASLRIGDEIPILKEFRLDADNNPIRTFDRENVGLDVTVTPSIAENRDVSMQLAIKISSVISGSTTTDDNQFTTSEREVNTNVVVKDRQALVISGLMRDNATENNSGVPGLRKAPGVGKLFGSEDTVGEKGELLILIKPHVITNDDEARMIGDAQLRRHPEAVRAGAVQPEVMEFDL